ncbi:hypothetical protein ACI797_18045 [Geodermatophilus sp. SYSU D00691]
MVPDELTCTGCGHTAGAAALAAGWSLSRPPRATGRTGPRTDAESRTTALCPDCARHHVRALEARLDP